MKTSTKIPVASEGQVESIDVNWSKKLVLEDWSSGDLLEFRKADLVNGSLFLYEYKKFGEAPSSNLFILPKDETEKLREFLGGVNE